MEASRNKPEQAQTKTSRFQHMQCAQIFVVSKYGRLPAMFFKIGELSASKRRGMSAEGFGLVSLVRPWNVRFAIFFPGLPTITITNTIITITVTIAITITFTIYYLLLTAYYLLFALYYLLIILYYLLVTLYYLLFTIYQYSDYYYDYYYSYYYY